MLINKGRWPYYQRKVYYHPDEVYTLLNLSALCLNGFDDVRFKRSEGVMSGLEELLKQQAELEEQIKEAVKK